MFGGRDWQIAMRFALGLFVLAMMALGAIVGIAFYEFLLQ